MNQQPLSKAVAVLSGRLLYQFRAPELLEQALVHSSWAAEQGDPAASNERLEFLGDAVVGLVVATLLYRQYPDLREGDLSRTRAALVNEAHLARLAGEIGLAQFLLLGQGEEQSGGKAKPSILSSAFEALVGALYLDGGYQAAHTTLARLFAPVIAAPPTPEESDSKSALQEILQQRYGAAPDYILEEEKGPAHERRFTVAVSFQGRILGRGTAGRKKEAQRRAAAEALQALGENY